MFCSELILIIATCTSVSVLADSIMAYNLPKTMRAVGFYKRLPISDVHSLVDLEVALPELEKNEVLIEVKATAVNPVDTKIRAPKQSDKINTEVNKIYSIRPHILGWDGSGVVVATGENVLLFTDGDEVFFTGDLRKNGSNAQYVAIDEILVGPKPKNLTYEEAAAMPLTSVTAYEALYDRLLISEKDYGKTILIINSAGGVGSVASQLAKNLGLVVIGTASRAATETFAYGNGVDIVLNHTKNLIFELEAHAFGYGVDYILVNYDPFPYWDTLMAAIKPQGKICLIADSSGLVDLRLLKDKSVTLVSETMATRMKYNTEDKFRHHEILKELSKMFERGILKSTLTKTMSPINSTNLRVAHRLIEEKHMYGKLVLSGFH